MNVANEPCQFLQWDTEFFGHRIGRIIGHDLNPNRIESIYAWSESSAIECLYFLANSDDPVTIRFAEANEFQLVEIRLTMERSLKNWNAKTRSKAADDIFIRHAHSEDIPILQEIARNSYLDSRFYFDECFTEENWQTYYATWIKKSCEGGADLALVAEKENEIVGYITGNVVEGKAEGIYELTGVKPSARRAGVGQELFRSGLDWYKKMGIENIWLATQGRNIATQRMVQRDGFITKSCQLYYHKWFNPCSNKGKA